MFDRSKPIKAGKASSTEGTFPDAVYFILKYADKWEYCEALLDKLPLLKA